MTFRRDSSWWLAALLAITLAGVAVVLSGCATKPSYQAPQPPPLSAMAPPLSAMDQRPFIRAVALPVSVPLLWDASPDAVAGYAMYWGMGGDVTNRMDVGATLQVTVSNLVAGSEYFFYVIAYDALGTESEPSNTLLYTPPVGPQDQVFTYTIQHWGSGGVWTNLISILVTNPPQSIFRIALELVP